MRVVLVRHAESEWNAERRWQGQLGSGLTERGRAQADATARFLHRTEPDVVLVARSDLQRVAETAAPAEALLGTDVLVDERWREIDVGSWSGLTHEEIAAVDPDAYAEWRDGRDIARGGGETFAALRRRAWAALTDLCGRVDAGTAVVFTHGGPIRAVLAEALRMPPGGDRCFAATANCSVTALVRRDGRFLVAAYNARGHLVG